MRKGKLKSIITLSVAAVMSMSMLAGCGSSNSTAKGNGELPEAKHELNPNEPGYKATAKDPITLDWYINFNWFGSKWGQGDVVSQYITEKTGVSVNFITPPGNEAEKLNTMIASGSLPDIITLGWWEDAVKKMIEGELVLPLNELADKYDPYFYKVADEAKLGWYKQPNGNVYGYPNSSSSPAQLEEYKDVTPSNQTFLVRKDMYEAIGSPDMSTPEGFIAALEAAKEKFPSVDGQPLIPLGLHEFTATGNYSLEGYLQNFLAIPMENEDGTLHDRQTDPEYLAWLKTFREANEKGLLSKDIFIDKRAQMEEKISQGRYFAMIYQRSDMSSPEQALYTKDPNSVYIAVEGPKNSKGDEHKLAGPGIAGWTLTLISKDCKDPERAIQFLSYLISEEGNKDIYLGKEGVMWDMVDGKETIKPEVLELANSDRAAYDKKYGGMSTYWMMQDNNMFLNWAPEAVEPFAQMENWTKGKIANYAPYDDINPPAESEEGIMGAKLGEEWGLVLPKLLQAKSEAEFDQIWSDYQAKRKDIGLDKVTEYQNNKVKENKEKLGMK